LALESRPDSHGLFAFVFDLYQEQLFEFEEAHTLTSSWQQRHPQDLVDQAKLGEAQLTTGRFAAAAQSLAGLLRPGKLPALHIALLTLEVTALAPLGNLKELPVHLQALRAAVVAQPTGFGLNWNFAGVKTFLARDAQVTAQRSWLLELITAVEQPQRAARLNALDTVIAHQPTPPPG
jgi:hypothetical protein